MNTYFKNQFIRTKEIHKEIFIHSFFKRPVMLVIYGLFVFILFLNIPSIISSGSFSLTNINGFTTLFAAVLFAATIVRYFRMTDISYKRDLENNNGEQIEAIITLTDDGIDICRANSESRNHIQYRSVRKVITTRNSFLLITETEQYIVIKKDSFVVGTSDEFFTYITRRVSQS